MRKEVSNILKKKAILTAAAVSVLGAGILSASTAFAQTTTSTQDPMNSIVQKIADKFNLNKDDVQAVFDEAHEEQHAKMEANFESQLSQYVSEGKITEAQKKLIIEKRTEMESQMKADRDSFKNLSQDERKSQMETKRAELESWAKENNIDLQYLMPKFGKGGPGMGGHRGFGQGADDQQSTVAPTATQ